MASGCAVLEEENKQRSEAKEDRTTHQTQHTNCYIETYNRMSLLKSFSKRKLLADKALSADRKPKKEPSERRLKEEEKGEQMKVACLKREVKILDDGHHQASSGHFDDANPTVNGKVRGEFELSLRASGDEAQHLEQFFAGVDALKEAMRRVKTTNRRLRDLHEQAFDDAATEAHDVRAAFTKLVDKNEALFAEVREKTLNLKDVPLTSDSFRKLKHNILNGTNMKSAQLLLDFKSVLKDYNQRLKEETWRQLKEQRLDDKGDALPDDGHDDDYDFHDAFDPNIEQVGDFMQKFIFRYAHLSVVVVMVVCVGVDPQVLCCVVRREKASSAKKYLEEKQRDLEVIEKNMMELNELMKDFAVMVESANEPLDQIDTYLHATKVHSCIHSCIHSLLSDIWTQW